MSENNYSFGNTCVCIARVSTSRQDYEAQIKALHKRAGEFGYTVIKDIETKESGFRSFDKKEGFKELVEFLNQNNCRIVMCTELSRLSRKKILLEQIKQWFIDNKIQLWVDDLSFKLFDETTMSISMTTEITFSVFAAMAESEMKEKFKRLKRGRIELVKDGYSIGGKTCFGYDRIKAAEKRKGKFRSKMVINQEQADQIRMIFDWYLNGIDGITDKCSISQIQNECIARGFHKYLHSKRNVNKALKYEPYTGELVKTEHRQKNPEYWDYGNPNAPKYLPASSEMKLPMIIDRKTFDAVQKKMKGADPKNKADSSSPLGFADKSRIHFSLLSKMIECPVCHRYYCGEYRIKNNTRGISVNYRCLNHTPHGASTLSMRYLDFAAWSFTRAQQSEYIEYLKTNPIKTNAEEIKQRIGNIEQKKTQLHEELKKLSLRFLYVKDKISIDDLLPEFDRETDRIKKEISKCDELIDNENETLRYHLDTIEKARLSADYFTKINGNRLEMKKVIQHTIKRIIPVYHDSTYYVLWIGLRDDVYHSYTIDPNDYNDNGLPYNNYVIIDKRDNLRPKFRLISANCAFDVDKKVFYLPDSATGTLEQVFTDEDEVYFQSIEYKPMRIYNDDAPGDKVMTELIRPTPAPPPRRTRKKPENSDNDDTPSL